VRHAHRLFSGIADRVRVAHSTHFLLVIPAQAGIQFWALEESRTQGADMNSSMIQFAFMLTGLFGVIALLGIYGRLVSIELKLHLLMRHFDIPPQLASTLPERVKQLAADPGRKVAAIKALREETGVGLREAKALVDMFIASRQP